MKKSNELGLHIVKMLKITSEITCHAEGSDEHRRLYHELVREIHRLNNCIDYKLYAVTYKDGSEVVYSTLAEAKKVYTSDSFAVDLYSFDKFGNCHTIAIDNK